MSYSIVSFLATGFGLDPAQTEAGQLVAVAWVAAASLSTPNPMQLEGASFSLLTLLRNASSTVLYSEQWLWSAPRECRC